MPPRGIVHHISTQSRTGQWEIHTPLVVVGGVAIALALGMTIVAVGASPRPAGSMVIALAPIVWLLSHLIGRFMGREIRLDSAPYPCRWMNVGAGRP